MNTIPTGFVSSDEPGSLTWQRTFHVPLGDVWAAATESDRLARWIGTWTGDPADGFVMFTMNAEGDGVQPARYDIRACEPPRLLQVGVTDEFGAWRLSLRLDEAGGVTTVTMSQVVDDAAMVENTGPGWEYYLDRLVVAEAGGDAASVSWDDYYPAQREYYLTLAARFGAEHESM